MFFHENIDTLVDEVTVSVCCFVVHQAEKYVPATWAQELQWLQDLYLHTSLKRVSQHLHVQQTRRNHILQILQQAVDQRHRLMSLLHKSFTQSHWSKVSVSGLQFFPLTWRFRSKTTNNEHRRRTEVWGKKKNPPQTRKGAEVSTCQLKNPPKKGNWETSMWRYEL